jgi:multiple sugar transport system permease protein/putative aldouronate transport system permease protein
MKQTRASVALIAAYLFVAVMVICCTLPFYLVIMNSFALPQDLVREGFSLLPNRLSLAGYKYLLGSAGIGRNYRVSIFVTVVGTAMATLVTAGYAYGLAHPRMRYRGVLSFLTYIPSILGSGLVGFYLLMVKYLHLYDSLWSLILPYVLSPFNAFVMVAFLRDLPYELYEAAYLDGANDARVFFQVILPISAIPMMTVLLFYALAYWNDWWLATLFIQDTSKQPLQTLIRAILNRQVMASHLGSLTNLRVEPLTVQLVTVCVTIGPILLVYPFIQRYFIRGITVGAVKG